MNIALDAMGGDFAPREIVRGGVEAAAKLKGVGSVILVGAEPAIREELQRWGGRVGSRIRIVHASENVGMDESPAVAVRRKKDASINRCMELLKNGEANAVVAAGNSGAVVAAAMFNLGRIKGVVRPAIATILPTRNRPLLLLDAGANTDCQEQWLAQFAIMGTVYSQAVLHQPNPVLGLLSIGTEDGKGNEVTKKAFGLIQHAGLNFRGNVEGHDLFIGQTDVVVCDGFVGNVVLKTTESVAHAIGFWMKQEFFRHPIRVLGAMLLKGALTAMKHRMDPEVYGGAPLLGVPGNVIITHGASTHRAIYHAVRVAAAAAHHNVSGTIAERIAAAGDFGANRDTPGAQ
ncbi:MAG: phosphate acyltransferase PlsX [Kiritimatiellia bacterium]